MSIQTGYLRGYYSVKAKAAGRNDSGNGKKRMSSMYSEEGYLNAFNMCSGVREFRKSKKSRLIPIPGFTG